MSKKLTHIHIDPAIPDFTGTNVKEYDYLAAQGQMSRVCRIYENSLLVTTYHFAEDAVVGDVALRVDVINAGTAEEGGRSSLVTVTQGMLDCSELQANLAPTDITLSNNTVLNTSPIGTTIGTLSAIDPNPGDMHTFSIVSDPDNKFQISGNQLQLKNTVDPNISPSHQVTVRATDQGSLTFDKSLVIFVTQIQFVNDKATLFQGDTANTDMVGPASDLILPGSGSFTMSTWIKKNNPKVKPTDIANLVVWLDASDDTTITKDASNFVSQWDDKSGNGNNMAQATSANQPVWTQGSISGKSVIRFDGTDDNMSVQTNAFSGDQEYTVFAIFKADAFGGPFNLTRTMWSIGVGGGGSRGQSIFSLNKGTNVEVNRLGAWTTFATSLVLDTPTMATVRYDAGGGTDELWIDSVAQAVSSSSAGTYLFNNGIFRLGITTVTNNPAYYSGDLGEIILFNRALTTQERTDIENYLNDKWITPTILEESPADVSGLSMWFDADDASTITSSAGKVSQWDDKSGNGNHATQATPSQQPTVVSNGYGTRTTIAFADPQGLTTTYNTGADSTIFAVFFHNHGAVQPTGPVWLVDSTSNANGFFPKYVDGNQYVGVAGTVWMSKISTFANNTFYNTAVVYDSTSPLTELYVDGVLNDSTASAEDPGNNFMIGRREIGSLTHSLVGQIAEIIVYNKALTTGERQLVESYLNKKWNQGLNYVLPKTLIALHQNTPIVNPKAELRWNESDTLELRYHNGTALNTINALGNFGDNVYHNVVARYDSVAQNIELYVDSSLKSSVTDIITATGNAPARLGSFDGNAPYYDGLMDEVSVWDTAADPVHIYFGGFSQDLLSNTNLTGLRLWLRMGDPPDDFTTSGGVIDVSGNNLNFTANSMTATNCVSDSVIAIPANTISDLNSVEYNGIDQFSVIDADPSGDLFNMAAGTTGYPFTISTWFKTTAPATGDDDILQIQGAAQSEVYTRLQISGTTIRLQIRNAQSGDDTTNLDIDIATGGAGTDGNWHHVVASFISATETRIRFDGGTVIVAGGRNVWNRELIANFTIAARDSSGVVSSYSSIRSGDTAIWNVALSDAAMLEIYNSGKSYDVQKNGIDYKQIADLQAFWLMGDRSGDVHPVISDASGNSLNLAMVLFHPSADGFVVDAP